MKVEGENNFGECSFYFQFSTTWPYFRRKEELGGIFFCPGGKKGATGAVLRSNDRHFGRVRAGEAIFLLHASRSSSDGWLLRLA